MEQPKELSLGVRILLFIMGLGLVFVTYWAIKSFISGFHVTKYSAYLINLGTFCILLWLFIKSLIKIPIGSVGVPLILNTPYNGFLLPAGYTWLPIIQHRIVDKKIQFRDMDYEVILRGDSLPHIVQTNVEFSIVNPFIYLNNNENEIMKKINSGIEEKINQYSTERGNQGDTFLKDNGKIKKLISAELSHYGDKYGLAIAEVQIKSIKPSKKIVESNEELFERKRTKTLDIELKALDKALDIELNALDKTKQLEVLTLLSKKYGIPFNDIAKYILIDNGKIKLSEVIKSHNINLNVDSNFIENLLTILKK